MFRSVLLLLLLLLLLFSKLYNVFTSSCANLTIILCSSSSYFCHSSLLPSHLIPSAQGSLGLPRFLLPGGRDFITSFGNLPSSSLWTWPYHWSCCPICNTSQIADMSVKLATKKPSKYVWHYRDDNLQISKQVVLGDKLLLLYLHVII